MKVIEKIKESLKEEFKTPINLVASIITILIPLGNFLIPVLRNKQSENIEIGNINLGLNNIELGIILLVILEGCLGTVFGRLIVWIEDLGGGLARIILLATTLISAWVSIFNVNWLIKDTLILNGKLRIENINGVVVFAVLLILIISLYLIQHHGNKYQKIDSYAEGHSFTPFLMQMFSFFIIYQFSSMN